MLHKIKILIPVLLLLLMAGDAYSASFTLSSGATVADNYYVSPNGNDNNTCLSTGTACASQQGALAKLPNKVDKTVTIHMASGTYTPSATNGAAIYVDKQASGNNLISFRGYVNSTANSFTDSASDSGTSSGSNTNNFPINSTPAADNTYFYDTTKSWTTNQWANMRLRITGGTGFYGSSSFDNIYNWYVIIGNTSTRLNIMGRWTSAIPDATTTYEIYDLANSPNVTVGSANYCVTTNKAFGISFMFMKCLEPTVGSFNIINSNDVSLSATNLLGGDSWISHSRKIRLNNLILQVTSSRNRGFTIVSKSDVLLNYTFINDFIGEGFYSNDSNVGLYGSYIVSTSTSPADDGISLNTGFYADAGSMVDITLSSIAGRNSITFVNDVLVATFNTHIQLQSNVLLSGFSNSSNTYGPTISHHSTMEILTGPVLITNVWKGTTISNVSYFNAIPDASYSSIGAGGNETIEANSLKDTVIH